MDNRKLNVVRSIARKLDIDPKSIEVSNREGKRFKILLSTGKTIHFGLFPFRGKGAFIDHKDEQTRIAWKARHSKILKDGKPAYKNPLSAEFYSWNLLW